MSNTATWTRCVDDLRHELTPQQFNTWILPLHAIPEQPGHDQHTLQIQAPNRYIKEWVADKFLTRISELVGTYRPDTQLIVEISAPGSMPAVRKAGNGGQNDNANKIILSESPADVAPPVIDTGTFNLNRTSLTADSNSRGREGNTNASGRFIDHRQNIINRDNAESQPQAPTQSSAPKVEVEVEGGIRHANSLIKHYTFDDFVEGKSNQLARAAATQVAKGTGTSYNPLFLYGGVGLGKTHLMHAVGHEILKKNPNARVVYLHSERFVADMVKALQLNAINEFKRYYRSVDALLIDDIQFFADKDRSQEEFFHTFNALLEGNKQMILTCDRYPKEIKGLEERLKSRFGWGLTCAMDPPDLETRVAIVNKKAELEKVDIPNECAFFIASKVRSNVRELEGALKRIIAQAKFTNSQIDIGLVKDSMRDLLALQDRLVTIDNIQRTVAEYFRIKVSDLTSKRRSRSVARPRQIAMTLAKELTNHSLPEIGNDFGGRDHTTVLHACRKIKELREENADLAEDYQNLLRSLTT